MVEDGTFYGGSPIWIQAGKAGMVSASYFFVGSEANVQGLHPTYFYQYDGSVKNETRVAQVIDWLNLPEKERPHMITMYFSDMDDTGHRFGADNEDELKRTLFNLDTNLGDLFKGVKATGLPVNIIIVSDHGMANVPTDHLIAIDDIKNDSLYTTIDNGAIVNIHPALLPKYGGKGMYGMHVHKAVVAANVKESGITIHYVNAQYDEGAIVFQAKCKLIAKFS